MYSVSMQSSSECHICFLMKKIQKWKKAWLSFPKKDYSQCTLKIQEIVSSVKAGVSQWCSPAAEQLNTVFFNSRHLKTKPHCQWVLLLHHNEVPSLALPSQFRLIFSPNSSLTNSIKLGKRFDPFAWQFGNGILLLLQFKNTKSFLFNIIGRLLR